MGAGERWAASGPQGREPQGAEGFLRRGAVRRWGTRAAWDILGSPSRPSALPSPMGSRLRLPDRVAGQERPARSGERAGTGGVSGLGNGVLSSSSWRKPLQALPWRAQPSSCHCHPDGQPRPEPRVRLSSTRSPPQGLPGAGWEQVGAEAAALTEHSPPATSYGYWLCPPAHRGGSRRWHRWHGAEATLGLASTLPPAGPSLGRVIGAHRSRPPTKTGSTGTRSFTFLPLSSPNCSPQGDAIRPYHPHSSLPWPCQAPTPAVEAGEPGKGPFGRAPAGRASRPPRTQNDRDLDLASQGQPRGVFRGRGGGGAGHSPLKTRPWGRSPNPTALP